MVAAYLSLGSNIGDRLRFLTQATRRLNEHIDINIVKISSIYETAAWGIDDQADFYNVVLMIETNLTPVALLKACQKIEYELERVREIRWGPRTIDIDILLYEGVEMKESILTIPHKYLLERAFVSIPLAEIAPDEQVVGVKIATVAMSHARLADKCLKTEYKIDIELER